MCMGVVLLPASRSPKWARHYVGSMLVTKVLSPTNFCIQKSKHSNSKVAHMDKLKSCRGVTPHSWLDNYESSDEEQEDDPGLPARLEKTQRRTTTYQISLSCSLTGMERSTFRRRMNTVWSLNRQRHRTAGRRWRRNMYLITMTSSQSVQSECESLKAISGILFTTIYSRLV